MTAREKKDWGDYEDDEELPAPSETEPDENGIVTRTEWTWKDGRKTKIVQRFQVKSITTRVAKRTYPRKEWPRFGDAKDELFKGDEQFVTVEDPNVLTEEEPAADMKGLGIIMQKLQARKKGLIARSGPEDSFMNYDDSAAAGGEEKMRGAGAGGDRYVPPGKLMGGGRDDDKFPTLRVTNVSEDTTDEDLKQLFRRFGDIYRVFLAKDKERQTSRGFAFVSFYRREDAQRAMDELQGYGYDHLILRLEWANPPSQRREQGEGLSGMGFVSGYGQKLAQDTNLTYSTASNLTYGTDR